ncbi:MAG: xanthine dehydrogenase family protein molybdopterin-binding subunit [Acidimicrobiia bacterium]|nr:xanthine dehydrogenase family protein molybdopterin-binding subunit [Acidimicrobiia bacterium]NNL28229.1 xanthine dehydrogenase family protein molybdopterin-binding subunit [Acidimicrobiia bacterium]
MVVTEARKFIRADGPDKVTGSGRYVADISLTGMAVAKFKYAGIAHARITRLDVAKARAIPGVFAVLTQDDVPNVRFGAIPDRTLFASDVVRFEGEVVAAVAAIDTRTASEALDAIEVEYEPLPIVDDLELALDDESPLVHSGWSEYDADHVERNRNVASFSSIARGDVVAGFDEADVVITSAFEADASHAVPIEPRGILAQWEGENVTIWSATQVPFQARAGVCETLGLATNKVRVIVPHLGGGFGGKCGFHFEAHVAALARAAGRPVKLVFTREEEFVAPDRRREGMTIEVTTGLRKDGTLVARRGRLLLDNGAYTADADFFPQLAAMHLAGPYKVPNVLIEASLIYTNRQPSGSVRAPTAPQACWALESHTDELAAAVGMDPVDFRRLNAIDSGAVGVVGQTYGEIGLQACIEAAVDTIGYGSVVANDEAIGVAIGWWPSFPGPSGIYIKIDDDGAGQIITGAQECGTGAVMTLPGLVAGELGMRPEDFDLVYQDTSAAPYDVGATGSQTLLNNGRAALSGARELGRQLKELAAEHLEASAEDIILANGEASVAGSPTSSVSIVQLAAIAADNNLLLAHGSSEVLEDPPLVGSTCVGDQGVAAWSAPQFSCHAVRVRLDRETGVVRVLEVSAAHDSGTIINHVGAVGQVEGGVLMGIGQALTEGTRYDEGSKQLNPGLLEYKLQTIADAPSITTQFVEINTPDAGPHGAKGLAEAPNVATAGAIANAVAKLVGQPLRQLPMTAERIWEAV